MRAAYKLFLLGTATDLPTRPYVLAPRQSRANELFASVRKWNKVVSSRPQ